MVIIDHSFTYWTGSAALENYNDKIVKVDNNRHM